MGIASRNGTGSRTARSRIAKDREVALRQAVWGRPSAFAASFAPESLESRVMLAADVVISEIMYHPESGDPRDEYVELYNRGDAAANLEGWQFTKGIGYTFHGRTLQPGNYLVVAADLGRFQNKYPGVTNVIGGLWEGRLSNAGETIELEDAGGDTVDEVSYADEGDWASRSRPVNSWKPVTSIVRGFGTTATVTSSFHMFEVGDSVEIGGADQPEYNGVFIVTNATATTFAISPVSGSAPPAATGNIVARLRLDHGHVGWDWYQRADGRGSSLELINPSLSNNHGQNWGSSSGAGTPGAANSVARGDVAPLVLGVSHFPVVPKPTETVSITARLLDESGGGGLSATLHWRRDGETSFTPIAMADDGQHGDGLEGDGIWGANVPEQSDGTIVEFYITARDGGGKTRTWPAPALDHNGAPTADGAYPMYQVDAAPYSGLQPLFKLIMTEAERAELADIGASPSDGIAEQESNASMNGTFISIEPTGTEVRYLVGFRNRGAGSRDAQPNNYRVSFPGDSPWKDVTYLAINARYSMEEVAGSALFRQSGLPAQDAVPVQVRVNNSNLAVQNLDMFGSYVWMEAEGDTFASNHFPNDDDGNYYRGVRRYTTGLDSADLTYYGEDEDLYRLDYEKQTNEEADDYTDLIALTRAFDPVQTPGDAAFAEALSQLIDVNQWLRYFAATVMIGDMETTLATGYGDDYSLYRGEDDARFRIIVHDLDTILGRGDTTANPQRSIFMAAASPAIDRFLKSPTFAPMFYAQLVDLVNTTFDPANLKQTLTNALGSYVPADVIDLMRDFAQQRKTYVLSQIPRSLTATSALVPQNGYPHTTADNVNLSGKADVVNTRSVLVNGQPANWVAWQGTWTLDGVALQPGVNRIVVQAMEGDGMEIARTTYDVWRDVLPGTVGGTLPAGTTTWTAAGGPYHVTSDLMVPAGSTLVIAPGTTVYVTPGVKISVLGTLDAEGTADKRIRFTRVPGSTGGWNGIVLDYVTAVPTAQRQDNRIAYADFEYGDGGGEAILADKANLYLDNLIFSNHTKQYIDVTDSSIVLSNSYLPGISTGELVHYWGFPSDGYALIEGNTFGFTSGYNDIIDFTGGQRPGPIAQFLNNTFLGGSDDALDLDAVDAHIEGNAFTNFHQDAARESKSHAVSTGTEGGVYSEVTIVRNFFYDVDHAILIKDGAVGTIVNNTIVKVYKVHPDATTAAINLYEPRSGQWPGAGVYLENNIFQDVSAMFENPVTPGYDVSITVNNSIYPLIPGEPVWPGTGNYHGDPHLLNPTNPTDLRRDFQLRPGAGPARGTGYNGVDRGAAIAPGAWVGGEPRGTTDSTSATLAVGGPHIYAYKYRVNDGPWSAEVPVSNSGLPNHVVPPIQLDGLADGTYTVYVIAKNSAGFWQDASAPTASRTWAVSTTATRPVRISEVLANNAGISYGGRVGRDLVELHNPGLSPVSLAGMSLSDNPASPRKYVFGDVTLQPGGYVVIYGGNTDGGAGLFAGFSLSEDGEGLYLYDTPGRGGGLVDSAVFGSQLENLSIARVGGEDAWRLATPTLGEANVAQPTGDPTRLRINEWLASGRDPFNNDFFEIWNPDPLPVDMGGVSVTDAPDGWPDRHVVTPLTFVGGGKHFVFTADDDVDQGADHTSFSLAAEQGLIAVFDRDGREMDRVLYGTQRPGVSQGRSPDGDGRFVFFTQPSPGASNPGTGQQPVTKTYDLFGFEMEWRYYEAGAPADQDGLTWKDTAYGDAAWSQGAGLLYVEGSSLPQAKRTPLTIGQNTYYFRTTFNLAVDPATLSGLPLRTVLDDGAVIYVNGHEVKRHGMPEAPAVIGHATPADRNVPNAAVETISLDDAIQYLVQGDNVIAVEVHQATTDSTDVVWGGELKATQTLNNAEPSPLTLRVTEINYNPPDGGASGSTSDDYEFIELMNVGGGFINLDGVRFTAGPEFTFGGVGLAPGRRVVIVKNRDAFVGRYGALADIAGEYGGALDNGGGQIRLVDINGLVVQDFVYSRLWYPETDGDAGHTLTIRDAGAATSWSDPAGWRGSHFVFGSPLADDATAPALPGTVVVSEVMTRGSGAEGDWIELHNVTGSPVDVGGWLLSDSRANLMKYRIATGTSIPAFGRLRLTQADDFGSSADPNTVVPFSLDDLGGEVFVSSGVTDGFKLTGYHERATFGAAAEADRSFVRHTNSVGEVEYVAAAAATPGEEDAAPLVGPVVISEVMYDPAGTGHEFVELRNITDGPVSIGGWRFTDGIVFEFPQGAVIAAGGVVVVAPVAPEFFRAAYGLADDVVVFGPYTGALENDGERLALGEPLGAVNGTVPFALVDHVRFSGVAPWPASAAGQGPSLVRVTAPAATFGNEPQSWTAGPNGGTPGDGAVVSPILVNGTAGEDAFEIRLNAAGTHVEIVRGGEILHSLPVGPSAPVVVNGLDGDDRVLVNFTNGVPIPGGGITFGGGAGTDALAVAGAAADAALAFDDDSGAVGGSAFVHGGIERIELAMPQAAWLSLGGAVEAAVAPGPGGVFSTGGITIDPSARLDLGDGELLVKDGDLAAVTALVRSARNGGAVRWNGKGIGTSAAAPLTGLGVTAQGTDVLVKHTYNGDANLDGRVNADDYFRIDQGFLAQPQNPRFNQGDFNYDGRVNADDFFLIDQAFLGQGGIMSGGVESSAPSPTVASAAVTAVTSDERTTRARKTSSTLASRVTETVRRFSRRKISRSR